ncbi:MAG: hypothetical protein DMG58_32370 [Acidobacteria bacterium]|nr:MAG: hypothetical protein DMG58_32370 [Acidobacteriota bacterium]
MALTRLEYWRDWSNQEFFDRGATPASAKSQSTILVAFIALFGPKDEFWSAVHVRLIRNLSGSHKFFCLDWFGSRNYAP